MKRKPKELNLAELRADAFLLLSFIYSFIQDHPRIDKREFEQKANIYLLPALADFLQARAKAEKEREKERKEKARIEKALLLAGQKRFEQMEKYFN